MVSVHGQGLDGNPRRTQARWTSAAVDDLKHCSGDLEQNGQDPEFLFDVSECQPESVSRQTPR